MAGLIRGGQTEFLEPGPGRVLSGLVARVSRGLSRANLETAEQLDAAADFASARHKA